ncbi:lipoyl synthase [Andreesenia angusta]|uniref:Lipoyl synthase n=1 Tax=Andreesenia angusta TaxID=39480 RepID=A0A1S1V4B8_9FIRM|nr:lipoyl synthase [Andreesenia angusta]OHW61541.1 lipoyl synthase [Andreesenia angusta]
MIIKRKPEWLRIKKREGENLGYVKHILEDLSLNTVCEAANCPNRAECFSKRTATFMILGRECTRNCRFCNVSSNPVEAVNPEEPENVAEATVKLGLQHVVITSVTRDDLKDGGAEHFAKTIRAIKEKDPKIIVEVLIPDLQGDVDALKVVVDAKPDILNHNIETVPRLYPDVRPMAIYERSLEVLENSKKIDPNMLTKTGIMLGLGEKEEEVIQVFKDLREKGCDFLTVGQYLPPSDEHVELVEYVHPDQFEKYKEEALALGFKFVASSPLVRSSYKAADMFAASESAE